MRFADEVRIVGQLEHPGIVPVYDVGRDESGHVYLVMKHLDGETMEEIIDKLRAGDPGTVASYTIEYRVRLFVLVLDAIRYAHARGVIHRDLKPANIMIGPYGEVTVLDWGIAKPIHREAPGTRLVEPLQRTLVDSHDKRLQETQFGSLAGTPLYMSPEQSAGRNDELDARSDVYSLCIVLLEWLSLKHPLSDKQTVPEVLAATIGGLDVQHVVGEALDAGTPIEFARCIMKGIARDRDKRYPSVDALDADIRRALDGCVRIECPVTLTKRVLQETAHWIDRHPKLYLSAFAAASLATASGLIYGAYRLVRAIGA